MSCGMNKKNGPQGNIQTVYLFLGIGLAILLTACINYINLNTAQGMDRAKEVGVRKTVGAPRIQLIYQFMIETVILTCIAFLIALGLVEASVPYTNEILGKPVSLEIDIQFLATLLGLSVLVSFVAGLYPAFALSRYQPSITVQKRFIAQKGSWLRNSLVICQFSVACILFIGAFIVHSQITYVLDRNPGFDSDFLITMPIFETDKRLRKEGVPLRERYQVVKESFLQHPNVLSASATRRTMGLRGKGVERVVKPETDRDGTYRIELQMVDEDFLSVYDIALLEGRNFSPADSMDKFIINETAARYFRYE